LANPTTHKDYCKENSDVHTDLRDWTENQECTELWEVSAAPNIPAMSSRTRDSMKKAVQRLVAVNEIETGRTMRIQKEQH
jgi:hypothetical protein